MRVPIIVGQACAYCFEPFETRMVPVNFSSRSDNISQIWLHVRCAEAAFRDSKATFDWHDLAVDVDPPPNGSGWAEIPDDYPFPPAT